MKALLPILFIFILSACGAGGGYEKASDPQDAGREFIRASLDGDHQKARFYLLQDTTNMLLMERQQRDYERLTHEQKAEHREASIRPINIRKINDSTTLYVYYNTYNPKDTTSMHVVRAHGDWLVDLKSILKR